MRKLTKTEEATASALKGAALFHVTPTILNKNIQDCNGALRELLKAKGFVDLDALQPGERVELEGKFLDGSATAISAYRAKTRGDKRIWFSNLKNHADPGDIMALVIRRGKLVLQNVTKGVVVAVLVVSSVGTVPGITY